MNKNTIGISLPNSDIFITKLHHNIISIENYTNVI